MEKKSYAELLKDPRWQKKRLEIMQRDNFTCQLCGSKEKHLNVHHLYYNGYKEPWEYENDAMITVCDECHKLEHEKLNREIIGRKISLGNVCTFDHSDFSCYMICYYINYETKNAFFIGVDDGSGYDSAFDAAFHVSDIGKKCTIIDKFFDSNYKDDYFQKSLMYVFYGLVTGRKSIDTYFIYTSEENVISHLRFNLFDILKNNSSLNKLFLQALNDESSVIKY